MTTIELDRDDKKVCGQCRSTTSGVVWTHGVDGLSKIGETNDESGGELA